MDTSTVSFTDLDTRARTDEIPKTSIAFRAAPQPGVKVEWLSRLISPLTLTPAQDDSAAASAASASASAPSSPVLPNMQDPWLPAPASVIARPSQPTSGSGSDNDVGYSTLLLVLIPVMVVVLTVLLGLVMFLVAVLYMRRRRGIR